MKLKGEASAGMIAGSGRFILTTSLYFAGASTEATCVYQALRELGTPSGGKMILSSDALTSAAVSGVPSWNFTLSRILNVYDKRVSDTCQFPSTNIGRASLRVRVCQYV